MTAKSASGRAPSGRPGTRPVGRGRTPAGSAPGAGEGAPEAGLAGCVVVPSTADTTLQGISSGGARVVAIATREAADLTALGPDDERDLRLGGFITFIDRPKADAGASIAKLNQLGIAVKIITGNNGLVAAKVCRDLGVRVEKVSTGVDRDGVDGAALGADRPHPTSGTRVLPPR